ncbi:MAG: lamin tail domain-containing protein [Candidatus Pacebacteria bacterium]|nr:lamin tail domain-containing protein [Candidatus Paceibacterota bacterium]
MNFVLKSISLACISGIMLITNLPMFNAFEAHVVNVTGQICYKEGETRTIGYWKTHPEITEKYLPINLEEDVVSTIDEAINIFNFNGEANIMENKLNAQLLAIKLNVAHYSINEYILKENSQFISSTIEELANDDKLMQAMWINDYFLNKDELVLSEIIHDADEMLLSIHASHELEAMMKLLDNFNNLHDNLNYCVPLPITLNEILPNPIGDDNKIMPEGEWVELYNYGKSDIDIDGWYLYNKYEHQPIIISQLNADNNGDTTDLGETVVPANGWLVVYINGMHALEWINNNSDEIRLYNDELDSGKLISYYSFDNPVPENKTLARVPDGIGKWYDPIPTPGMPNILEETLEVDLNDSENIMTSNIVEDIPLVPIDILDDNILPSSETTLNDDLVDTGDNNNPESVIEDADIIDMKSESIPETIVSPVETNSDDDLLNADALQGEVVVLDNDLVDTSDNNNPEDVDVIDMKNEGVIEDSVLSTEDSDDLDDDLLDTNTVQDKILTLNDEIVVANSGDVSENVIEDVNVIDMKNEGVIEDLLLLPDKNDKSYIDSDELLGDNAQLQEEVILSKEIMTETNETDNPDPIIEDDAVIKNEDIVENISLSLQADKNSPDINSEEDETLENTGNNSGITADEDTTQIQFNLNI